MCGIAGIWSRNVLNESQAIAIRNAAKCIAMRGPDSQGFYISEKVHLAHQRLSIIDTDARSNQPMSDPSGRYTMIFNGEIYNFKQLGAELMKKYGVAFRTSGDTEVLLQGLILEGSNFLHKLNGFFAFGFYDLAQHRLLLARDRYGIKPLYHSALGTNFVFGSNLGAVMALGAEKKVDFSSLSQYLQLSYIPAPATILTDVSKLEPGHFLQISESGTTSQSFYSLPQKEISEVPEFESAARQFRDKLEESVSARLIADVPVGTFLSGGLDSSVISLLANRLQPNIPTFSIGFPDQPFFDESPYASEIAKHIEAKHHIFEVREKDLDEKLIDILDTIDEPFADSSAVLVNLLSEYARKEVKVALSGDGADELLGGYNKHIALLRSVGNGALNRALSSGSQILSTLPSSRNSKMYNQLRKAQRYSQGLKLSFPDRYLAWASFTQKSEVDALLRPAHRHAARTGEMDHLLAELNETDFNSVLRADFKLVLPNDMLHKVDSMSMHRALEVRVPFLDHHLVDFCFGLPANFKISKNKGKLLMREAFAKDFPPGIFERNKRGFEAPLQHWFRTVLKEQMDVLLSPKLIERQAIFDIAAIRLLQKKVAGNNPGDAPHTLWAVLLFQYWWKKHLA